MTYQFKDLYKFSEDFICAKCEASAGEIFVPVTKLIRQLELHVPWLRNVKVHPIKDTKDDDTVWGMYERLADQDAQYETEDSEIVYIAHGAWQNRCYKRFVCAKELLHILDGAEAMVSHASDYSMLTGEIEDFQHIETRPLTPSPQMKSEIDAQWRAMLLLCPKPERDKIVNDTEGNDYTWAYRYALPEAIIETIKSPSYEMAYKALISN